MCSIYCSTLCFAALYILLTLHIYALYASYMLCWKRRKEKAKKKTWRLAEERRGMACGVTAWRKKRNNNGGGGINGALHLYGIIIRKACNNAKRKENSCEKAMKSAIAYRMWRGGARVRKTWRGVKTSIMSHLYLLAAAYNNNNIIKSAHLQRQRHHNNQKYGGSKRALSPTAASNMACHPAK